MRILSIDPSIKNIGWAVIDTDLPIEKSLLGSGTIHTKTDTDHEQCVEIVELISQLFILNNNDFQGMPILGYDPAQHPHSQKHRLAVQERLIELVVIEKPPILHQNSIEQETFVAGIISAACVNHCRNIKYITPLEWSDGKSETLIRFDANKIFNLDLEKKDENESEAIGIGLWRRMRELS